MQNDGEDVVVQKGCHNRDLMGCGSRRQAGGVRAAALPSLDQPFFFQEPQGVTDSLAAQVVLPAELLFRRQLVPGLTAAAAQLVPKLVCQKLVFCCHACASFHCFSHPLYQMLTAN